MGLILILAACSSDQAPSSTTAPSTAEAEETQPAEAAADETEPAETQPLEDDSTGVSEEPVSDSAEPAGEPAAVEDPQPDEAFASANVALENLESYRYKTSFLFVGEEDGETESGSMELTGVISSSDRKHLTWRDLSEGDSFEIVQIGDEAWALQDGEWQSVPLLVADAMSQVALVYAPSVTWNGLFGELQPDATYVGMETVNGVSAQHFTATYQQWGSYWQGDLVDATGDIWIAEAGYPVKYHFSAAGIDEDGSHGTVTWTMDISDVNQPIDIAPPTLADEGEDDETY